MASLRLLGNIGQLATCLAQGGQDEVHPISDAALVWQGDKCLWLGKESELPGEFAGAERWDGGGGLVIPGLVDSHTHLAFGGWRAEEFELRCRGAGYQDIARSGGGIASTVRHTRTASQAELVDRCIGFASRMLSLGVTTAEVKSGYGLTTEDELKLLRTYREAADRSALRMVATFLGAHIVPAEFQDDRDRYVDLIISEMLPAVAQESLASFCDVFVEDTAFSVAEGRKILAAARELGLGAKVHADQLEAGGGAELAAEFRAASADHLEHVSAGGMKALAEAGTVAVSLPLASLYLRQQPMPARRLIEAGVPVAVATDFNPGSAPSYHLPFALTLACTMQQMTPAEALKGATIYAARAVGLENEIGSLEPGKAADFAILDSASVNDWLYHLRPNCCRSTVVGGEEVWRAPERVRQ